MPRYIDADFVSGRLREVLHGPKSEFPDDFEQAINCLVYAISILEFAPTADVEPVVHAHWLKINNPNYSPFDQSSEYYLFCSNCECGHVQMYDFCPSCGAKMDEKV